MTLCYYYQNFWCLKALKEQVAAAGFRVKPGPLPSCIYVWMVNGIGLMMQIKSLFFPRCSFLEFGGKK